MTWMLYRRRRLHRGAHRARVRRRADCRSSSSTTCRPASGRTSRTTCRSCRRRSPDADAVRGALREHGVTGVLHLAAKKAVGESVEQPLLYWDENVGGMRSLLQSCLAEGVDRVLFSSSAAVFGEPPVELVTEETPAAPISPYGETEAGRRVDAARPGQRRTPLRWAALRYFNVAGTGAPELADRSVDNLVPMVFQALSPRTATRSCSATTTPTRDGSCIRDYIHVVDLAEAHAAAAAPARRGPARRGLQRRPRRGHHRQGGLRDGPRGHRHRLHGGRRRPPRRRRAGLLRRRDEDRRAARLDRPARPARHGASAWDGWQKRG